MIQLEQLEDMFSNIAEGAKWDMTGPMLWGYFFTDADRSKLESAASELVAQGYRFVDVKTRLVLNHFLEQRRLLGLPVLQGLDG